MNNDLTVTKSNSFVEASYSMTLDEMRILNLALGVFDPLNPKREFEFTIDDFCKTYPEVNKKSAYAQVDNAIKNICTRWVTLENNDNITREVILITDRTYFKTEGRFQISFHEKLLPYISNLKERYTKYNLINICTFTKTHTVRLYELMAQYKKIGVREIKIIDIKYWLQIENKYERFNSMRERVLSPAIAEINQKSDLLVTFDVIKRGRKIHSVKFFIVEKSNNKNAKSNQKRPKFPHKNKYGNYVKLNKQNPKMSSHECGIYARDCLEILENFYMDFGEITDNDLRNYWVFLSINQSHKSKFGNRQKFIDELKNRGYKLVDCELVKL